MGTATTPQENRILPAPGGLEPAGCPHLPEPGAHRRARQVVTLCATGTLALGALGLADALTGQRLFGGSVLPQYISMAVSTALLCLFFGGTLALTTSQLQGQARRPLLLAAILLATGFGAVECVEYVFGLPDSALEQHYGRLLALFSITPTPMSPVTSALFLLAGSAIGLLHFRPRQATASWRNDVAGYLGVAVSFASLTLLGGYLHGTPFLYGTNVVPVAVTTSVAFLLVGTGLICAAGPGSLFLRAFFGDSVKARLMRIFPPFVAAMFLFHPVVEIIVSRIFPIHPDLLFSLQVTVLAALTAAVTSLTVRVVGVSIDRETEMRQLAESKALEESRINKAQADIALSKETDKTLRELNERLEEKVRERTIQLEERTKSILLVNRDLQLQIETRRLAEEALAGSARNLQAKVRQITCLYELSEHLANASAEQFAAAFERSLGELGRFLQFEHVAVFVYAEDAGQFRLAHQWRAEGLEPLGGGAGELDQRLASLLLKRLPAQEKLIIREVAQLPPEAPDMPLLLEAGIRSLAAVPMTIRGRLRGALLLAGTGESPSSGFSELSLLDNVALLLANAQEKHRVDRSLRESERLARSIIESLAANICVVDSAGFLTMINQAWERFAQENSPDTAANVGVGTNYLEVCRTAAAKGEPKAAEAAEGIAAVLAGKLPLFNLEYDCHSPTAQRWFIMQVVPFTAGGSGAVISHRDITARVLATAEVRRSEERYRIIVETAQEGVLGVDAESTITYANPRMIAMLGYAFDDLIGRKLQEVIAPEDMELIRGKQRERRRGLSDQYELRYLSKAGAHIWTMTSVAPVMGSDGRYTGTIGMSTDISDRVRAEQRIRRSEARYRSLVEAMQEGLLMIKASGKISYMNDPFARILGRPRTEILGHPVEDFVSPKSAAALTAMLSGSRPDSGAVEVVWEHSSGKHIYSLFSLSTSRDEEGRITGYYAIVTDTTERKALESQLLQSQKLEAIGQLAAGIAHEINTPAQYVGSNVKFIKSAFEDLADTVEAMRKVIAEAKEEPLSAADIEAVEELLKARDIDYLEAEVPGAIAQTLEGVERISTIVRSVKQFAHPGSSVMGPADLNEAMKSTVAVSRNEWKYVAELETDLDEALPLVTCMIGEINQVVLNLIVNAAHAIADAIKNDPERKGHIALITRYAPPWAEIRVTDTGSGIPPEVQAKIFDPFFTTKEVGEGTGQGLTISRGIVVDKHKGQLFFETEPGVGTTFVVRLPLAQGEEREG